MCVCVCVFVCVCMCLDGILCKCLQGPFNWWLYLFIYLFIYFWSCLLIKMWYWNYPLSLCDVQYGISVLVVFLLWTWIKGYLELQCIHCWLFFWWICNIFCFLFSLVPFWNLFYQISYTFLPLGSISLKYIFFCSFNPEITPILDGQVIFLVVA